MKASRRTAPSTVPSEVTRESRPCRGSASPQEQPTEEITMIGELIAAIVIGIIAGFLGRALLPGPDPMGFVATVGVGIAGALVGYFIFRLIGIGDDDKFDLGGI